MMLQSSTCFLLSSQLSTQEVRIVSVMVVYCIASLLCLLSLCASAFQSPASQLLFIRTRKNQQQQRHHEFQSGDDRYNFSVVDGSRHRQQRFTIIKSDDVSDHDDTIDIHRVFIDNQHHNQRSCHPGTVNPSKEGVNRANFFNNTTATFLLSLAVMTSVLFNSIQPAYAKGGGSGSSSSSSGSRTSSRIYHDDNSAFEDVVVAGSLSAAGIVTISRRWKDQEFDRYFDNVEDGEQATTKTTDKEDNSLLLKMKSGIYEGTTTESDGITQKVKLKLTMDPKNGIAKRIRI